MIYNMRAGMKLLTAIIRPETLNRVAAQLAENGIMRVTATHCHGIGAVDGVEQDSLTRPKVKLEIALPSDELLDKAMGVINKVCHSGSPVDGVMFVCDIGGAQNIGSGVEGPEAL